MDNEEDQECNCECAKTCGGGVRRNTLRVDLSGHCTVRVHVLHTV